MTVEITDDGSATLCSPLCGDTYHSMRGAVGEARHVFIEAGWGWSRRIDLHCGTRDGAVRVFEMGFGTGLNAWLTLLEAEKSGRQVEYTAIELYPVPVRTAAQLNYTDDARFMTMHGAPWGEWTEIANGFRLLKLHADLEEVLTKWEKTGNFDPHNAPVLPGFDVVYYDAFAPETQPRLWTAEIFARIFEIMSSGGVLVTYSAKGDVRRALREAGFEVERLPGALGKRHMLRAIKI